MVELSAYREAFIEEMIDQLDKMEQDLLALEKKVSSETVQSIFRSAHTIKGSSAAMGFEEMKRLTHEVEHLLDKVRGGRLEADPKLINLLFHALDVKKTLRDEYIRESPYSDISQVLLDLKLFETGAGASLPWKPLPEPNLEQMGQMRGAVQSGLRLLKLQIDLVDDCVMKAARFQLVVHEIAARYGSILQSDPPIDVDYNVADSVYSEAVFVISTALEAAEIQSHAAKMTDVRLARAENYLLPDASGGQQDQLGTPGQPLDSVSLQEELHEGLPAASHGLAQSGWSASAEPSKHAPSAAEEKQKQAPQTIRVSVERLEHLMNLIGELLIDQTSLAQLKQTVSQRSMDANFAERFNELSDHMTDIVEELQESVMKVRMLPIEHLFNRFPRMVRDLSRKLDKEIELVLDGMETELDRTLIEEIGDPLIHLIRNAVDHGIESREDRLRAGKNPSGRVRLDSFHEDNQIVIMIEDDGAGIDPVKIKASAIRKGLITEEEAGRLTEQEAVHLVFLPGFSTAAAVSEVSGRGVGMDIVRNQIERLHGFIQIESVVGSGTRFTIRLPLTLAIITGLMVRVSSRDFIIPMHNVIEIVRMPMDQIQTMHGRSVILLRNEVIPLIRLNETLQIPEDGSKRKKYQPVVVVGSAEKKLALAVDELLGNQQVVIKSLGTFLGKIPYIAGATILGSGRVALILEIAYLINQMRLK